MRSRLAALGLALLVATLGACGANQPTTPRPPSPTPQRMALTPSPTTPPVLAPDPNAEISLDRNFYLVLDGSGSMEAAGCAGRDPVTQQAFANRIEAAKWAVKTFLKESVPAEVNVGLYVFDGAGRSERVPIAKDNRAELARAIDALAGGGNTPLNASIRFGVDQLLRQRARQLDYGEYYLVVATDGEATDGDTAPTVAYATQHGIPIITLGYCLKQDHPLARGSFSYRNANSPAELLAALKETQAEARYADVKPGGR